MDPFLRAGLIPETSSVLTNKAKVIPKAEEQKRKAVNYCNQHPDNEIKLYCYDCKQVLCFSCHAKMHTDHKCTDVKEAAGKSIDELKDVIERLEVSASLSQKDLELMVKEKKVLIESVAVIQHEISLEYDRIMALVQSHHFQLIGELNSFRNKRLKEIKVRRVEIERQVTIIKGFKRYCQEIVEQGAAADISRAPSDLHIRAAEVIKSQEASRVSETSRIGVTLNPSLLITDTGKNLIGELTFKGSGLYV